MILRVFPRKTNATPNDKNVRFGDPGLFDEADEIHISVCFTWDKERAEYLAEQWKMIAPVKIGGPGIGMWGEQFEPGMYLKKGYVITSRGCPNKCWFCDVWRRDGNIRELEIREGWNILDDNLLACSDQHIMNVFKMLQKQNREIEFTGGLEAKIFKEWHLKEILKLRIGGLFFAYDTPDDYKPLSEVAEMMRDYKWKFSHHSAKCYVLIGSPKDTLEKAEKRLIDVIHLGFMPQAMLYRNHNGKRDPKWISFQREWANKIIVGFKMKQYDTN